MIENEKVHRNEEGDEKVIEEVKVGDYEAVDEVE